MMNACGGARDLSPPSDLTEAFKIPAAIDPASVPTALIGKEILNFFRR